MVLPLILAVAFIAMLVVGLVLLLGGGRFRLGSLRLVRRIRTARRRNLAPLLWRLGRRVRMVSQRPGRRSVAGQLRRLALRVEGAHRAARDFERSQRELAQGIERIRQLADQRGVRPGASRQSGVAGWTAASLLAGFVIAILATALAAANAWVLAEYVMPRVPDATWFPFPLPQGLFVPVGISVASLLLGLAYYAFLAIENLGSQLLIVLVALLIMAVGVLEGVTAVAALFGARVVDMGWWGGITVAVLLGVAAGLAPPLIAVTAQSALERLRQWVGGRERRAAARAANAQYRAGSDLPAVLDRMESSLSAVQVQLSTLELASAGRLLLSPDGEASVGRATRVLRRLADTVEEDYDAPGEKEAGPETPAFLLRDLAALGAWGLATITALLLALVAVGPGIPAGMPVSLLASLVAVVGLLCLGGVIIRWVVSRTSSAEDAVVRAAMVLVWGLAAASAGAAFASLIATAPYFHGSALMAGATLTLFILVAGTASIRLPEAVAAVATMVYLLLAGSAWVVLRLVDLALAGIDAVLVGFRRRPSSSRRYRGGDAGRSIAALGADRSAR